MQNNSPSDADNRPAMDAITDAMTEFFTSEHWHSFKGTLDRLLQGVDNAHNTQTADPLKPIAQDVTFHKIWAEFISGFPDFLMNSLTADFNPNSESINTQVKDWRLTLDNIVKEYEHINFADRPNEKEAFERFKSDFLSVLRSFPAAQQITIFESTSNSATHQERTYTTALATALTNLLKQFLHSNPTKTIDSEGNTLYSVHMENPKRGRISVANPPDTKDTLITYKGNDGEYKISVERVSELFAKRVQNGAKIFNFLLQKLNEQNRSESTEFMLSELIDAGIYASPDTAYRGLKTVLDKLMHIYVEGVVISHEGRKRKETFNHKSAIVAARTVSYNKCSVILPPIIRNSAPYYTILPKWSYTLQSDNAYMLLDYIYYLARQNTKQIREYGFFTIKMDTIRQHLGFPSPDTVKNTFSSAYSKFIINPIEDAIAAIEDKQQDNGLTITPSYDANYKNIYEYLNGTLEIRLTGEAFDYMERLAGGHKIRIQG